MYCGSCMRDNALAGALRAAGHEVVLTPVYTPTLTDEVNHSLNRVFFGGISVYLQQKSALFRHTPRFLDKLWDSEAALRMASQRSVGVDPRFLGEMTVSMLEGERGPIRKEFAKLTEWLKTESRPDVISLPFTLLIALAEPMKRVTGSPVVCTLQGEDLFLDGLAEPWRSRSLELIGEQIRHVDAFVATSEYYAGYMTGYLGVPAAKVRVVPLGINFTGLGPAEKRHAGFRVGFFARIAPEKGLHNLIEAVERLEGVELHAAGYNLPEHREYLAKWEKRMIYHGSPDREGKAEFLRGMDVLSVPTDYVEPKGLFVLESWACGTPVVQPAHGAFPEMIRKTGGGLLVPPRDQGALAAALAKLRDDAALRRELGAKGEAGVREHYSMEAMTRAALDVYHGVA
jgi:glycosyltransferase involved in cell wall biosynthesis